MGALELFNKNERLAYYVLKKHYSWLVHDEDAIQTALLGLWKACLSYDEEKNPAFVPFAIIVIRREILQIVRGLSERNHQQYCEEEFSCGLEWADVEGFLNRLDTGQRQAVELMMAGYSRKEAAEQLGITRQGVAARLKKARRVFNAYI